MNNIFKLFPFILFFTLTAPININYEVGFQLQNKDSFSSDDAFEYSDPLIDKINNSYRNKENKLNIYFYEFGDQHHSDKYKYHSDSFIITYNTTQILVDAGLGCSITSDSDSDVVKNGVGYLKNRMRAILEAEPDGPNGEKVWEYVIFTHPDADHIIGAPELLKTNEFHIAHVYDFQSATITKDNELFKDYCKAIDEYKKTDGYTEYDAVPTFFSGQGDVIKNPTINLGNEVTLTFLYNSHASSIQDEDANNVSVCFIIQYKNQKFLFTGDIEDIDKNNSNIGYGAEHDLYENNKSIIGENITFYKAAHHGSNTSNSEELMSHLRPKYIVIPAVAGSSQYGSSQNNYFPCQTVLDTFRKYTKNIYIPSYGVNENLDGAKPGPKLYDSFYGDILLQFNGVDATVYSKNLSNRNYLTNVNFEDSAWYNDYRSTTPKFRIITFVDGKNNFSNCTLVKYKSIEILIDCGSSDDKSKSFVNRIKTYCLDHTLEYLIVTHAHSYNISQLVGDEKNPGLFDLEKFTVANLIDFDKTNIRSKQGDGKILTKYLEKKNELINSGVLKDHPFSSNAIDFETDISDFTFKCIASVAQRVGDESSTVEEDNYSLTTVVRFKNKKFLFVGDLSAYDNLINSYSKDIENVTYYKASCGLTSCANSNEFMNKVSPTYTTISSPINNIVYNFGNVSYCYNLINNTNNQNVFASSYLDDGKFKELNGETIYTYSPYEEIEDSITCINGEQAKKLNPVDIFPVS